MQVEFGLSKLQETLYVNTNADTSVLLRPGDSEFSVSNLFPYTYYNVVVATVLQDSTFVVSTLFLATTSAPPQTAVTNVRQLSKTPTTIFIGFTPAMSSGPNISYMVFQTNLVRNETLAYRGAFGDNIGPAANAVLPSLICEANTMALFTFNLVPNTAYSFALVQHTADGPGPRSVPIILRTLPDVQAQLDPPSFVSRIRQ